MPNKILLVDDDKEFREEFKEYLDEYDVVEAATGEEALQILKRANEIDLVILDVRLPGTSGTEVLRQMKETLPDLGIIILTGFGSKDVAVKALKAHADDYIEKPFDPEKTRETICRILDEKHRLAGASPNSIKSKIAHARDYIERNCYKKIGLGDVAAAVSLSPKYLSRVFFEVSGMRFNDFKLGVKMGKARQMLAGGYSVNEIADKLGYENPESFIRQFKKQERCTPTEFRKKAGAKKRSRKR